MTIKAIYATAVFTALCACGDPNEPDFFTDEGKAELVAQFRAAEDPDRETPVVRSNAQYERYLNLFRDACLVNVPDLAQSKVAFQNAGLRSVPTAQYTPSISGYFAPTPANMATMSDIYAELSLSMQREDGMVPYILGFSGTSGATVSTYTNGVAVAEVSVGRAINDGCSVRIKSPSDTPLLTQLQRVVNETGLATGAPQNTGILGTGYILGTSPQTFIHLSREARSDQSPTRITVTIFNKR